MKFLTINYQIIALLIILTLGNPITINKRQINLSTENYSINSPKNLLTIPVQKRSQEVNKSQKLLNFLKEGQRSITQTKLTNGALNFIQKSTKPNKSIINNSYSKELIEIQLNNFLETQYSGKISIGNPKNQLNVVFDTGIIDDYHLKHYNVLCISGSTLLWVNSVRCGDIDCSQHTQYDHNESKHFAPVLIDKPYTTLFGSGKLTGILSRDWVYLGNLTIKNFEFAEIVSQDAILQNADFDGVMGLSFPDIDREYGILNSIIDSIKEQNLLAKNMFSFYLRRDTNIGDSKIIFGGYDENLLVEPITWSNVVSSDYWMIKGENILVDGKDYGLCIDDCYFIMDTGTSILTGPSFQLDVVLDSIDVDDECKNYYDLPKITFVIEGQNFSLDPTDYILALSDQEQEALPYDEPLVDDIIDCVSVFYPMDLIDQQNGNVWILGDTFLSKFYTIYDRDNMKVGIALQKDNTQA